MINAFFKTNLLPILFFFVGGICLFLTRDAPIKDFGNYYYGSKLLLDGKFTSEMYTSIHYFNQQISLYGESNFFENYIPVPPFSALFYAPFCFFKSITAKFIFNSISLVLFCLSLFRLFKLVEIRHWSLHLLPLIFIYPIYNNIAQGQTYLLISAFLLEGFISSEKGRIIYPSLLFAIIISLKLFPVFILIYFLFKKQFKIVLTTLGLTSALFVLTYLILPENTTFYYLTNVLPRLFNNDVVGTYHHGNQSVYTALLQLFSYDALSNPNPILNNTYLVILFESLFYSFVLTIIIFNRKLHSLIMYAIVLFSVVLLGRYSASYAMLFLLPLCIVLTTVKTKPLILTTTLLIVAATISLPIGAMVHLPFLFKFGRLIGLLILFFIVISIFNLNFNIKLLSFIFFPMFLFKYFFFSILPVNYFEFQNSQGILFDIEIKLDSLILKSALGEKDFEETYKLNGNITRSANLRIINNNIYYNGLKISNTNDNKLNPFIYNDSNVVFMSDLNQGVAFYKLRMLSLKEKR